jgi:hypothetical protein
LYCAEQCEENFYDAENTESGKMFYPLQGIETWSKSPIKVREVRLHFEKGSRLKGRETDPRPEKSRNIREVTCGWDFF